MIKILRDWQGKLALKVEGEIKIDSSTIKPYDAYVKAEEDKQKESLIYALLREIAPPPPVSLHSWSSHLLDMEIGHVSALKALAKYLAKEC